MLMLGSARLRWPSGPLTVGSAPPRWPVRVPDVAHAMRRNGGRFVAQNSFTEGFCHWASA
jgi:hypothetical protein